LRVAALIASISKQYGGPAYSVRRLWQTVAEQGVSVTVHSADNFHVAETDEDRAIWQPLAYHRWPAVAGTRALGYSTKMASGLTDVLRDDDSIISQHGLWLYQGKVARETSRKLDVPVIVHPHGMLEPWALRRSGWKKRMVGFLWERENLKRAACLRVTAQSELESVRRFGLKNPVALIPNGVDVDDFTSLPDPATADELFPALKGRRMLLFLSRLHPKKGLPMLLGAWSKLGAERKDWVLAIAGVDVGGHAGQLRQMIDELGLSSSVSFLGPLFGQDKLAAYARAEVFVLPSHSENFGVAIAEALAAGVPVITTKGTPWQGLEEYGCGWWVEPDEQSLEASLREALSLPPVELARMGARGRGWVARDFAWERIAEQMMEVCVWCLGGGSPPDCVVVN
jgi:glycosyltransferase involved in cell wall biosynthesis